jgi:hypothetical protein
MTLMPEDCEGCGVFFGISAWCGDVQGACLWCCALQADLQNDANAGGL